MSARRKVTLRAATLEAIKFHVEAEYEASRSEAEAVYEQEAADGTTQINVLLPDDTKIGKVSIKAGPVAMTVDDDGLIDWVRERNPDGLEDYADATAFRDAAVLNLIKAHFPTLVKQRVRAATRTAYLKEAGEKGGRLTDDAGEFLQLVKTSTSAATGAFAFSGGKSEERRAAIMAALQAGDPELRAIAFGGLLAITPAEAAAETTPNGDPE